MEEFMTEKEQAILLIDAYANLQRLKSADDLQQELAYQISTVKAKLEALGIPTETLER